MSSQLQIPTLEEIINRLLLADRIVTTTNEVIRERSFAA